MIEEVRKLLKKIDNIVESEYRRLTDEIDELKLMLKNSEKNNDDYCDLQEENEYLVAELESSKKIISELQEEVSILKKHKNMVDKLNQKINGMQHKTHRLTEELNGLTFTVSVITEWIPSQKENIAVLVALSTSPNHSASFEELNEKTSIPLVTLKNRIIPMLESNSLVSISNNIVKLTVRKEKMG